MRGFVFNGKKRLDLIDQLGFKPKALEVWESETIELVLIEIGHFDEH